MNKKIAIPMDGGTLSTHFGHCKQFAIIDVVDERITKMKILEPPDHIPGQYPKWIASLGVSDVIAAGMGQKAIALFDRHHINVFLGASQKKPEIIVEEYIRGILTLSMNQCNHNGHHDCHGK